jgi:hypothetical protein
MSFQRTSLASVAGSADQQSVQSAINDVVRVHPTAQRLKAAIATRAHAAWKPPGPVPSIAVFVEPVELIVTGNIGSSGQCESGELAHCPAHTILDIQPESSLRAVDTNKKTAPSIYLDRDPELVRAAQAWREALGFPGTSTPISDIDNDFDTTQACWTCRARNLLPRNTQWEKHAALWTPIGGHGVLHFESPDGPTVSKSSNIICESYNSVDAAGSDSSDDPPLDTFSSVLDTLACIQNQILKPVATTSRTFDHPTSAGEAPPVVQAPNQFFAASTQQLRPKPHQTHGTANGFGLHNTTAPASATCLSSHEQLVDSDMSDILVQKMDLASDATEHPMIVRSGLRSFRVRQTRHSVPETITTDPLVLL